MGSEEQPVAIAGYFKGTLHGGIINSSKLVIADLVRLASYGRDKLLIDYDQEADVLYVNFGKPQRADDAIQGKDGIIRRKKGNKIIGLTILNASRFSK